jgi:hypothetical protein
MPNLNALILHSSPRVFATGRLIKGLYYSERSNGITLWQRSIWPVTSFSNRSRS